MMLEKEMRNSFLDLKELIISRTEVHFKRRPLYKFKALVRQVINNLHWLAGIELLIGEDVSQNISNVLHKKTAEELFTLEIKGKFRKKPTERTFSDIEKMYDVLMNYEWFRSYPEQVRKRLPSRLRHVYYGPDRLVNREGHVPQSSYYIISGKVSLKQKTSDAAGAVAAKLSRELGPGERFGELALVHDIKRRMTITTKTHCEFLVLTKEDFDLVLKNFLKKQFEKLTTSLELFRPYFPRWSKAMARECCLSSRLDTRPPDTVIIGHNNYGKQNCVYFLVSGVCKMIQHIEMEVYYRDGKKCYREYVPKKAVTSDFLSRTLSKASMSITEKSQSPKPQNSTLQELFPFYQPSVTFEEKEEVTEIQCHFVEVAIIRPGGCFGFGENLNDRYIISSTDVTLFMIPIYWLRAHNITYMMLGMAAFFDHRYPTQKELIGRILKDRGWKRSKETFVKSSFENVRETGTFSHDVPFYYRLGYEVDAAHFNKSRFVSEKKGLKKAY